MKEFGCQVTLSSMFPTNYGSWISLGGGGQKSLM